MSSKTQIAANRANARHSTGLRTEAGKAAVAQNRATHGLASHSFFFLPDEDPEEFHQLLAGYTYEHPPGGATVSFLIRELAQADWKLRRAGRIEEALLAGPEYPEGAYSLAAIFQAGATSDQALLKLTRYENTIRRNYYRALGELRAIRREHTSQVAAEARHIQAEADAELKHAMAVIENEPRPFLNAGNHSKPTPQPAPDPTSTAPQAQNHSKPISKPMPAHLERELAAHKRRDPVFDPKMDASQMSRELQRWFERNAV